MSFPGSTNAMRRPFAAFILAIVAATTTITTTTTETASAQSSARPQRGGAGGDVRGSNDAKEPDWMARPVELASVVLQIDSDANSDRRAFDAQTLASLVKSTVIADAAVEKATGMTAADARKFVSIDAQPNGSRFVQLIVTIRPGAPLGNNVDAPAATKAVLAEVCDRLRRATEESYNASIAGIEARRASLEAELADATARFEKASQALRAARAANPEGRPNDPRYQLPNLVQQKQQIEPTLAGLRARLRALTEDAAARANDKGAPGPSTNPSTNPSPPISATWSRLVALRAKRVADVKARMEQGQAGPRDVDDAEVALTETQALADALAPIMAWAARGPLAGGGATYGERGTDIPSVRASIAETEARLATINEQIEKLQPAADAPDGSSPEQMSVLVNEENRTRGDVENLQSQLRELRRSNRVGAPPRLTVLDGQASGK